MGTKDKRPIRFHKWRRPKARTAAENYRRLFREFPVGLFRTTPEGVMLDANPALVRMLGYPDRASLLRVNVAQLYRNPADRKEFLQELDQKNTVDRKGLALVRADGSIVWVDDYT